MDLIYKNEKKLYRIIFIFGLFFWIPLTIGTLGLIWIYMLFFFLFYLFAQSGLISHVRGNGVRVSEQQYPELYTQFQACCDKLEMKEKPELYIMNSDGILNALATKFLRHRYVILYSSIIDALKPYPAGINFYIGHELGHIKRGHLDWQFMMIPAGFFPLLGPAYSRAREYTCDLHGLHCCTKLNDAAFAMGVLATGAEHWSKLNIKNFMAQSENTGGFWMSFHELTSDYPWLCKRMTNVVAVSQGDTPTFPRRNFFAGLLALFVPRLGIGGGGLISLMIIVAIIGILAAIALPAYQDYTIRSKITSAFILGGEIKQKATPFIDEHRQLPQDLQIIGMPNDFSSDVVESVEITDSGFVLHLSSPEQVAGETILFQPYVAEDRSIQWTCNGGTLAVKYLPTLCKQ